MIKKILCAAIFLAHTPVLFAVHLANATQEIVPTIVPKQHQGPMPSRSNGLLHQAVMSMLGRNRLFLARADIDLLLGGRVRQEGFYFDKPLTFREDYNDRYSFMRSKYNLDMSASFGRRQYGKPVATAGIRMTGFNVWDNFDVYTPTVAEPVAFSPHSFLKKGEFSEHHHDGTVTQMFMEDGWLEVAFDKLARTPSPLPITFKAGYFKHQVGRGVSLGTYFDGAINYLGWDTPGNPGNNSNSSPGLKLTIGDPSDCALEMYYSKWRERSHGPDFTREEVRAKRLDVDDEATQEIQRGVHHDRDLFTARLLYHQDFGRKNDSHLYLEPYMVHVNAPELNIEFDGDASARITTFGCMAEYAHNGWKLNVEVAGQMGYEDVHAIDRNHLVVDDAYYLEDVTHFTNEEEGEDPTETDELYYESGQMGRLDIVGPQQAKYQSHILLGTRTNLAGGNDTSESLPYRAYYLSNETRHINANRTVQKNGSAIRYSNPEGEGAGKDSFAAGQYHSNKQFDFKPKADIGAVSRQIGGVYGSYKYKTGIKYFDENFEATGVNVADGLLINADIPFGGGERFRKGYRLSMQGFMAMADLSYTTPDRHWKFGAAVAHISGDDYPLNRQVNQKYKGFVPFKDADYTGHSVQSYAMLAARKIGRPSTFSDQLMHAPINYESIANLQYVGVGLKWRPCQHRSQLTIESNALYFLQDVPPFVWDKTATRDFGSSKMNNLYSKAQTDLGFTGHETGVRASAQLGFELNTVLTWRPIAACQIELLLATFVPGQLYKDIDGMPSAYTIRQNKDGDWRFDSFGSKVPVGGMLRVTYWF